MSRVLPLVVVLAAGCKDTSDTDDSDASPSLQGCIEVDPTTVDFGDVAVSDGAPATATIAIRNLCEAVDLELYGLELSDPTAPFTIGAIDSILLESGELADFEVTFDPQEAYERTDVQLLIASNDAETPTATVDLLGRGTVPRIEVDPTDYDFGAPFLGCGSDVPITIRNVGTADLVVTDVQFATGTIDFDFRSDLVLPLTLAPSAEAQVHVSYVGLDEFEDDAYLTVESDDPHTPEVVVFLTATASKYGDNLDVFEQPLESPADVLFVVDTSSSMAEEQDLLSASLDVFVDALTAAETDYQIAVITTDDPAFRGEVVTPGAADPAGDLAAQVLAGTSGSGDAQPQEMAYQATQSGGDAAPGGVFLRDDARLVIVAVTDGSDASPMSPADYVDHWLAIKGDDADLLRFHAIAGDIPTPSCDAAASTPLDETVALTGGEFVSICASDWDSTLGAIASASATRRDTFFLTQAPVPQTIEVTVDGISSSIGWEYDAGTNAVVFESAFVPEAGSDIEVHYELMPDCEG
jgi:hypothetical protein